MGHTVARPDLDHRHTAAHTTVSDRRADSPADSSTGVQTPWCGVLLGHTWL